MIVTLYKDVFYNGQGQIVSIGPGDTLTRRLPDDGTYDLTSAAERPETAATIKLLEEIMNLHAFRHYPDFVQTGHKIKAHIAVLSVPPARPSGEPGGAGGEPTDSQMLDWFDHLAKGRRVSWGFASNGGITIGPAANGCDDCFSYPNIRSVLAAAMQSASNKEKGT